MAKRLVAVVAGASRGAGKGIARALGEVGGVVYAVGRTSRDGLRPADGAPGCVEETAQEISELGGTGIPVVADCSREEDVAELFARVEREQGAIDVAVNAVWGGADVYTDRTQWLGSWGKPFFEQPLNAWEGIVVNALTSYYWVSVHAARRMSRRGHGLIVGITDFLMYGAAEDGHLNATEFGDYQAGNFHADLAHVALRRMMRAVAVELKAKKVAVVALMPGFMRTERVQRLMSDEKLQKQFRYDLSETTQYVGRAVAALARDPKVLRKTGRVHFVADLAAEYGFTDTDGTQPRFLLTA